MQHYERGNHSPAGITRLNQCIDIAALGGNGGVGERFSGIGGTHRRPAGFRPTCGYFKANLC